MVVILMNAFGVYKVKQRIQGKNSYIHQTIDYLLPNSFLY